MFNKIKKILLTFLTSDATVLDSNDIKIGLTAYSNGEKIVGKLDPFEYKDFYVTREVAKLIREEY